MSIRYSQKTNVAIALVAREQFKMLRLPKAGFDLLHECRADTLP